MDELANQPESRTSSSRKPRLEFRDSGGRIWTVYERPIPAEEWTDADRQSDLMGYGVGWLCFNANGWNRRLRLYSKDWRRLSDVQLEHLCTRALNDPTQTRSS